MVNVERAAVQFNVRVVSEKQRIFLRGKRVFKRRGLLFHFFGDGLQGGQGMERGRDAAAFPRRVAASEQRLKRPGLLSHFFGGGGQRSCISCPRVEEAKLLLERFSLGGAPSAREEEGRAAVVLSWRTTAMRHVMRRGGMLVHFLGRARVGEGRAAGA